MYNSSSPLISEMKAMRLPSGDQEGHLSCAPEEWVRLRVGPFSIGAVKISPRALNRARSPFGLSSTDSILFAAEMRLGRLASPSLGTLIEIGVDLPSRVSITCNSPFNSYTIRPSLSELGQRTSHVLLLVNSLVFPLPTS